MNYCLKKAISILLAITFLLPTLCEVYGNTSFIAYASDQQFSDECEADAFYEENYVSLFESIYASAGNWWVAKHIDGCPDNYFHNAVQDYIIKNGFCEKEKRVKYTQSILNPITNKYTNYGSIDLYREIDDEDDDVDSYFIWEVKPASYLLPERRKLALEQMENYTNDAIHVNHKEQFYSGGIDPLIGATSFTIDAPVGDAKYIVSYSSTFDGLIVYWFKRTIEYKNDKDKDKARKKAKEDVEKNKKKIEKEEEDEEKSISYKQDEEYSFDYNGNIVDSNGEIVISRNTIAFYMLSISALNVHFKNNCKTNNPSSKDVAGFEKTDELLIKLAEAVTSKTAAKVTAIIIDIKEIMEIFSVEVQAAGIEDYDEDTNYDTAEAEEELKTETQEQTTDYDRAGKTNPPRDPLIIHFSDTDEIEFTSLDYGVNFDLDANGFAEKTAWIKNNDGFLAIDINQNGKVDNGSELFGDNFIMSNNKKASSGFEALSNFDINDDKKIDINDAVFNDLLSLR